MNDLDQMTDFWQAALAYARGYNDDETYRDLVPTDGNGITVFLQQVPEAKSAKNRLHFDIYDGNPHAKVSQLLEMGASTIGDPVADGDWWWQAMADPEGNEFCVCQDFPQRKPGQQRKPGPAASSGQ